MVHFRFASVLTAVVVCSACAGAGGAGQNACTEIGASPGVGVTVSAAMAGSIKDAVLEVCAEQCRTHQLELYPGSDSVDLGCDDEDPESSCSASVRPNGTLVGFVVVDDLPEAPVGVTLVSGDEQYSTTATPEQVYPNGPDCPGAALQLSLMLNDGALTALT